jgi:hypothetical protein
VWPAISLHRFLLPRGGYTIDFKLVTTSYLGADLPLVIPAAFYWLRSPQKLVALKYQACHGTAGSCCG